MKYAAIGALLLALLGGCSNGRQWDTLDAMNRETRLAFYTPATLLGDDADPARGHAPDATFVALDGQWQTIPASELPICGDIGQVHFCVAPPLDKLAADPLAQARFIESLSLSHRKWKIVLLREPALDTRPREHFQLLARLLGPLDVALVLAPGEDRYLRSSPVGPGPDRGVRYVTLALRIPAALSSSESPLPWMARTRTDGVYAVLNARTDRLTWTLYDARGLQVDALILREAPPALGQVGVEQPRTFSVGEILAAARDLQETSSEKAP